MSTQHPEALRLADLLERDPSDWGGLTLGWKAAAELRRLHALNAELLEALKELLYARTDKAERMATAAITKAAGEEK